MQISQSLCFFLAVGKMDEQDFRVKIWAIERSWKVCCHCIFHYWNLLLKITNIILQKIRGHIMRVKHKKDVIWTLFLFSHFWLNSLSLSSHAAAVSWKVSKFLFCFSGECHFSVIPQDVLPLLFLWCLKNIRTTTIRANTTTPRQVPMYTSFPGTVGHHVSRVCLSIRYQHHLKKTNEINNNK